MHKRRFRRSVGGVTSAELRSLTGAFYAKIAPFVREELARRLADEESRPLSPLAGAGRG